MHTEQRRKDKSNICYIGFLIPLFITCIMIMILLIVKNCDNKNSVPENTSPSIEMEALDDLGHYYKITLSEKAIPIFTYKYFDEVIDVDIRSYRVYKKYHELETPMLYFNRTKRILIVFTNECNKSEMEVIYDE